MGPSWDHRSESEADQARVVFPHQLSWLINNPLRRLIVSPSTLTKQSEAGLFSVEQFSPQFSQLTEQGFAWINLVGNGILRDNLLVSVEVPQQASGVAPGEVSVNLSGPSLDSSGKQRWDLAGRFEIV